MGSGLSFPKDEYALIFNASALFQIKEEHCSETWIGIDGTGDVHKKIPRSFLASSGQRTFDQKFGSPNPEMGP